MISGSFIFVILNCMSLSPQINNELAALLPGTKSDVAVQSCEFGYDNGIMYAKTNIRAEINLRDEFQEEVRLKVSVLVDSYRDCRTENVEIIGEDSFSAKRTGLIAQSIKDFFQWEYRNLLINNPEYAKACRHY